MTSKDKRRVTFRTDCATGKRGYTSRRACLKAHGKARFRVRAYLCPQCWEFHAANNEKK